VGGLGRAPLEERWERGMDRADLRVRVWQTIEDEWNKSRRPGGAGTTDSSVVYERLVAEGVNAPPGVMDEILEALHAEGLISGPKYFDREGSRLHGARAIIEPEWRLGG
jgi:hypothetical protein